MGFDRRLTLLGLTLKNMKPFNRVNSSKFETTEHSMHLQSHKQPNSRRSYLTIKTDISDC